MAVSLREQLTAAWMKRCRSPTPLPDLPHLDAIDDAASPEQVRRELERTISECEAEAAEVERQLEQRRFIVEFLRDSIERASSVQVEPPGPTPVAPVRLRRRARQNQPPARQQVAPVSKQKPELFLAFVPIVTYVRIRVCFLKRKNAL